MNIKADNSRIMISDELRNRLSEEFLKEEKNQEIQDLQPERYATVAVTLHNAQDPIIGVLVGIEIVTTQLTITMHVQTSKAFSIIEAGTKSILGIVIDVGDRSIKHDIEHCDAISIDSVGLIEQLCIMSMRFVLHS